MVGDPPPRHDPMTVAPLRASQVTMPSADRVGRDDGRQTIPDWPQALEDQEHPSLFGSNLGRGTCRWSTSSSWRRTNGSRSLDREERHLSRSRRRICRRLIAARRKAIGSLSRCDGGTRGRKNCLVASRPSDGTLHALHLGGWVLAPRKVRCPSSHDTLQCTSGSTTDTPSCRQIVKRLKTVGNLLPNARNRSGIPRAVNAEASVTTQAIRPRRQCHRCGSPRPRSYPGRSGR